MKALGKVVVALGIAAVAVVGGSIALEQAGVETPLNAARNGAANAALDATGLKEKADAALRANVDRIAQKTGMPASVVEGAIDSLDIPSWQVTSVPAGATATGTSTIDYEGVGATVTTYDDPSVVTIDTGAGAVTMEVPPSAQGYMGYLGYL
ncbi:hypothetical protein [Adlercreutzia murintestinalis]|uniref:hypothetical protein n=1 Tax=Adlercreutzia murintestinalis TaxID=2941325 RepID=UPI00203D30EC|nr:hypothetical protein [Adlercreutzia murintestinalis]